MNITNIKGIGEKTAALFLKLNIENTADLLRHFPRNYDFFEDTVKICELTEGVRAVCAVCVTNPSVRYIRGKSIVSTYIEDGTGRINITYFNAPFIKNALKVGTEHVFRGRVIKKGNNYVMQQPKIYKVEDYEKLSNTYQPIYTTTKGLSTGTIQKSVKKAYEAELLLGVNKETSPLYDKLPKEILIKRGLMDYSEAVINMHMPADMDSLILARKRLAYQEFFEFIYHIETNRNKEFRKNNYPMIEVAEVNRFIEKLPFKLTIDQSSVWETIKNEMCSNHSMTRLVQGDVGSGKTIIAILSMLMAACNGYQAALMAPTEVLVSQHFETVCAMADKYKLPIHAEILTGSVKGSKRKEILEKIKSGEANFIIGTHALFQKEVEYKNLSLVITDEQHRFGVVQRETFKEKGDYPHVLIMSATPIPRTLAMILYGDLDVSQIHTMPQGRLPIKNCVVDTSFRNKAYEFVTKEVNKGNQVYIICPQVEEGELPGVENVVEYASKLKTELDESIRVEYIHGKMKPAQKDEIMNRMTRGLIDVLVSTTVIEVGVNVPNATLMYIENAERFGLAQLHQLRGRVGRNDKQSYCIFMMGNVTEKAKSRLEILNNSNDGFEIASEDMRLRGPGDIFGIRQSGDISFDIGDVYQDHELISEAYEDVISILSENANILSENTNIIID